MNLSELKSLVETEKKKARLILCEQAIPREKTKALIKDFWLQFKTAVENPDKRVDHKGVTFEDAMKNKKYWIQKPIVVEAGTDVHPTIRKIMISIMPMRDRSARTVAAAGAANYPGGVVSVHGPGKYDVHIPEVEAKVSKGVMELDIYYDPEKIKGPDDFRNYYNVLYRKIQEVVSHETVHFGQFAGRDSGWKKTKFEDLVPEQQKVIKNYVEYKRGSATFEKALQSRRAGVPITSEELKQVLRQVLRLYPDPEKWKVMEKEKIGVLGQSKTQMYLMDPAEVDAHVRGYNYLAQRSKGRLTLEKMIDDRINAFRCSGIARLIPGRLTWWDCLNNRQAKDVKKRWMEHASKYIPCSRRKDGTFINPKGCGAKGTGKKKQKTKHTNKQKKRALKLRDGMIQSVDYVKERSKVGDTKVETERAFRKIGVGLNVLGAGLFAKQVYDIVFHEKMSYKQQMDALEDIAYDVAKEIAITTTICVASGPLCVMYGAYAVGEMINSFLPSYSRVTSFLEDFLVSLFDERSWTTTPEEEAEFEREDQVLDSSNLPPYEEEPDHGPTDD